MRRGLFRLWSVVSAIWVAYWLWQHDIPCLLGLFSLHGYTWACSDPLVVPAHIFEEETALILGIPLLAWGLIEVTMWIAARFRKP
jgi:hypothetical protein